LSLQVESKHNSVLEAALLAEADKQWGHVTRFQTRLKKSREGSRSKILDTSKESSHLLRTYNPVLMEISAKYDALLPKVSASLVCPVCGSPDSHNKKNDRAWCFKCNIALVEESKAPWLGQIRIMAKDESLRKELRKLNPGINPNLYKRQR